MRLSMTGLLRQSNLIEGIDSQEADEASFKAWETFRRIKFNEMGHDHIYSLHSKVVALQDSPIDLWPGSYRDRSRVDVFVDGHKCTPAAQVMRAMDEWLEDLPNNSPKENHIRFEKIHPFIDGNGRVGRMLMWWQELKQTGKVQTILMADDKADYYKWFKEEE